MEIEKLKKDDFITERGGNRKIATIRFTPNGCIVLSNTSVQFLKLYDPLTNTYASISICCGKKDNDKAEFFITKDPDGWQLRRGAADTALFNCKALVSHVIKKTWEIHPHVNGEEMPKRIGFRIAHLPVDDDKNKDVFALIRKRL